MHILLVGIQWSGKWTQARKMLEQYPWYSFFEMGQKLRNFSELDEPLSAQVRDYLNAGKLVPLDIIEAMLNHYKNHHTGGNILFDGIPRSLEQLDLFEKVFPDYFILFLDLEKEEAIRRLANRRIDPTNGESFPADFKGDFSPFTGVKLIRREDDNEEAVTRRIATFYHNTLPLVAEWAARWKRVYRIDAGKSIDDVFEHIKVILSAY